MEMFAKISDAYDKLQAVMEEAPTDWANSCVHIEDTIHQLSPYIGKLKSSIASQLIQDYSSENQLVVDPFAGSGTVPYQAHLMKRKVFASDISIYAKLLSKAKLSAPATEDEALRCAERLLKTANSLPIPNLAVVPNWVQEFFHPQTLIEILKFATVARRSGNEFYFACFLGILHHQRPGFLSYPASHLTPYLRSNKYPREKYPEMYEYRELSPRLLAKIRRSFKRHNHVVENWEFRHSSVENVTLPEKFDALITSPPYMNTLDYGRDNRLRLWFINPEYNKPLDVPATKSRDAFEHAIQILAQKVESGLAPQGYCVLVVGEQAKGKVEYLSSLILALFEQFSPSLLLEKVIVDKIPDIRRARRNYQGTKNEHIIVFRKGNI